MFFSLGGVSFIPSGVHRANRSTARTSRRPLTQRLSPAAFTAEQYQQHQEQLALMHREQLEQVQLQQQANSTAAANSTHVSLLPGQHTHAAAVWPPALSDRPPSSCSSSTQGLANTVDQASAQFAASAVITADQLLALKTKEELGPGGGVNGVLSPSGMPHPRPRPPFKRRGYSECSQAGCW